MRISSKLRLESSKQNRMLKSIYPDLVLSFELSPFSSLFSSLAVAGGP
jgi:hypothetical protein